MTLIRVWQAKTSDHSLDFWTTNDEIYRAYIFLINQKIGSSSIIDLENKLTIVVKSAVTIASVL
jgi:hypothetical protein